MSEQDIERAVGEQGEPAADNPTAYSSRLGRFQRRVLAALFQHHQERGWATPMARGELVARLGGWGYGLQLSYRRGTDDTEIQVGYTGLEAARRHDRTYHATQVHVSRALQALYGWRLVQVGSAWEPQLQTASQELARLEADLARDLADPQAAYHGYCSSQRLLGREPALTSEGYLAQRQRVVEAWRAGQGRPTFRTQHVALTPAGRQLAAALRSHGQPGTTSPGDESVEADGFITCQPEARLLDDTQALRVGGGEPCR